MLCNNAGISAPGPVAPSLLAAHTWRAGEEAARDPRSLCRRLGQPEAWTRADLALAAAPPTGNPEQRLLAGRRVAQTPP